MPGTFSPPPRVIHPGMHHGTCVTRVLWCIPESLTSGFLSSRWREKPSRHSQHMCNAKFYVSGKRSMVEDSGNPQIYLGFPPYPQTNQDLCRIQWHDSKGLDGLSGTSGQVPDKPASDFVGIYRQISNTGRTKSHTLNVSFSSCSAVFAPIEAMC